MKYFLSAEERSSLDRLFKALENNEKKAERYNALLERHGPVQAQKGSLPIVSLTPESYLANPYYQQVHPQIATRGNWTLCYDEYKPNEPFVYDEISAKPPYFDETTRFGYFPTGFPFLAVKEDETTWMSVTPHEINTMAASILSARGEVLTYGLGLAYFPFMCVRRDEVAHVTIVERDEKAISLFEHLLLPFFPHQEKIRVVKDDAFHYAKKAPHFDYAFVDLWHLPEDGLPLYLQMRRYEARDPHCVFSYWVEPSLLSLLRRALIILIQEEIAGATDEDYDFAATPSDELINRLHRLYKKKEFHSFQELSLFLAEPSLRQVALALAY